MGKRHENKSVCLKCEEKLEEVSKDLSQAFKLIKEQFPDCHVSFGYRSPQEQEELYKRGYSRLKWPQSKHNRIPAQAIDLFRLVDGKAEFEMKWFKNIYNCLEKNGFDKIEWGGNWKKFPDGPHFETIVSREEFALGLPVI